MLLQAPTSWLNALIALAGSAVGNLRLINALPRNPLDATYRTSVNTPTTDANIAALINAAGRSIAVPVGYQPGWLEIPTAWVAQLASSPNVPQSGPLQLSADCGADFQGAWAAAFQSLGFTAYTPAAPGPWPVIAG